MAKRSWLIVLAAVGSALIYAGWRRGIFEQSLERMRRFGFPSASLYDAFASALFGSFYNRIAKEIAAIQSSDFALDVGSGPGHVAVRLAQIAPGITVAGVDIDPSMVKIANDRAGKERVVDRVHFELGDAAALPFPDDKFDIVFSTFSTHHWPDPGKGLAEIYRVLKPGGLAVIYDIADWLRHVEQHAPPLEQLLATTPFTPESFETIVALGPIPLVNRAIMRKAG